MTDKAILHRANGLLERLFKLDEELLNAWSFRFILEDLQGRALETVPRRHHNPIRVVRGAVLRSLIASVMATLDPPDGRGNRASMGQVLRGLEDVDVAACLMTSSRRAHEGRSLEEVRSAYEELRRGPLFTSTRALRNDALSHLLLNEEATPTVAYEMVYELHDQADEMVGDLLRLCDRERRRKEARMPELREIAAVFWDTYFKGMGKGSGVD